MSVRIDGLLPIGISASARDCLSMLCLERGRDRIEELPHMVGEVRCLMLACAILKDAEVVVLDETILAIRSTTSRGTRAFS